MWGCGLSDRELTYEYACGAPVEDDEGSPFRVCAPCESGHAVPTTGRQRKGDSLLLSGQEPSIGTRDALAV
jgi:hypothetical protein